MPLKWLLDERELRKKKDRICTKILQKDPLFFQHLAELSKRMPEMIDMSLWAAQEAISYREVPFQVGASALFYRNGQYVLHWGANFKPEKRVRGFDCDDATHCAEKMALEWGEEDDCNLMVGMITTGIPQEDSESGLETITLHSCGKCRRRFIESPIVKPYSVIATKHLKKDILEVQIVAQMMNLHNGNGYH